jgi:hypothetical protein
VSLPGRAYHQPQRTTPLVPYSDPEWTRLISTCRALTATAFTAALVSWRAGSGTCSPRPARIRWQGCTGSGTAGAK